MPLGSGLPAAVGDHEPIARHLFSDKLVRKDDKGRWMPRPQAFMPQRTEQGEWVISVTRVCNFADTVAIERNGIGVGRESERVLFAYTTMLAQQIRSVVVKDKEKNEVGTMDAVAEEPPPCHAHIVKYPDLIEGENAKLLQKDCAEDLAARAEPVTLRTLPAEEWEKRAIEKKRSSK